MKCLKKGQINRFGEKKESNCIDYAETSHCEKINPKAKRFANWCGNCQNWWHSSVRWR